MKVSFFVSRTLFSFSFGLFSVSLSTNVNPDNQINVRLGGGDKKGIRMNIPFFGARRPALGRGGGECFATEEKFIFRIKTVKIYFQKKVH